MNKNFTLKDIEVGHLVEVKDEKNGKIHLCLVLPNSSYKIGISGINMWMDLEYIITNKANIKITKVYGFTSNCDSHDLLVGNRPLLWEKKYDLLWNGMTSEEAHRKMWGDMADDIRISKFNWIKNNIGGDIYVGVNCFACEAAEENKYGCEFCPLCEKNTSSSCLNGLYNEWKCAKGFEKAKLAKEISELPWVEKNHV